MADLSQPAAITLAMMRESLSTALVCDALDSLGLREQSPRLAWPVKTTAGLLVGRCKTTLWSERTTADPHPYEKELLGRRHLPGRPGDDRRPPSGSMRSGIWGELAVNSGAEQRLCGGHR